MAEEITIQGTQATAKARNPLGVVGLSLITLGIYQIYWYYQINREMADFGRARGTDELGDSPGKSLLAVLFGWILLFIPTLISGYNTCKRVEAASRLGGKPDPMAAGLLFVLYIFISPVALWLVQDALNKAWQGQASGGGAQLPQQPEAASPAPAQPTPAASGPENPTQP